VGRSILSKKLAPRDFNPVTLLAKVEAVFTITGRGVAIIPAFLSDLHFRVKEPVQLRGPGGQIKNTYIASVELATTLDRCRLAFMLPPDIHKEDVPEGTEIWLTETREQKEEQ
jgi:hypothetical protein